MAAFSADRQEPGIPMIVDCHVNIWNDEDLRHPLFDQIQASRAAAIPAKADAETLYREMAGVERAIVFPLKYGETAGIASSDETCAAAVAKYPDKFVGFACVDPTEPAALETLRHAVEGLGLRGVKMGPIYQNFHLADPRVEPIYDYCERNGLPITMHMGTTYQPNCPIDYGRPLHVEPVALRHPELKLIMAHMGHPWEGECIAVFRKQPNVYAEISGLFYRPWQFYNTLLLAQEYGVCHKIFWGTDYPFSRVEEAIAGLKAVNRFTEGTALPRVAEENVERILHANPLEHWWHGGYGA